MEKKAVDGRSERGISQLYDGSWWGAIETSKKIEIRVAYHL